MAKVWPEIQLASEENRCELVLSGPEISSRLDREGLDSSVFSLSKLNYLEISRTNLVSLPDSLNGLANLARLSLHSNNLKAVPPSLGHLTVLKHLDVSRNQLGTLPDQLDRLVQLHDLNVSSNRIVCLPPIPHLSKLVVLDISHNLFEEFPSSLLNGGLEHLAEIKARGNAIRALPASLSRLQSLKNLDVEENKVLTVAGELGDHPKLKEIFLKGNPLSDRRLLKLITQCHHKQVLDYIRNHCPREQNDKDNNDPNKTKKKKRSKGGGSISESVTDVDKVTECIRVLQVNDNNPKVIVQDAVKDVRPYIVCCVLRNVDFQAEGKFKQFITLQTRLHENECKKRTVATIATHDLSKVTGDMTYDARPPAEISITPLSKTKSVTAQHLFAQLQKEAENLRKEKKRNTYSGIHKYLRLLEDKPVYPCLINGNGQVMSLPPITNSEETKISLDTKDVLLEVTSSESLTACKDVLDALVRETTKLEVHEEKDEQLNEVVNQCKMVVQQVKIVNREGLLRVVYPSHKDLPFEEFRIIHERN